MSDYDFSGVHGKPPKGTGKYMLFPLSVILGCLILGTLQFARFLDRDWIAQALRPPPKRQPFDHADWIRASQRGGMIDDILVRGIVCPGTPVDKVLAVLGRPDSSYSSSSTEDGRKASYRELSYVTERNYSFILEIRNRRLLEVSPPRDWPDLPRTSCWG